MRRSTTSKLQSLSKSAQCVVYPRSATTRCFTPRPATPSQVFTDGVRRSAAFFKGQFSEFTAQQILDCSPG